MKILKTSSSLLLIVGLGVATLLLVHCKKSASSSGGNGTFKITGTTYSGACKSGPHVSDSSCNNANIDVAVTSGSTAGMQLYIFNMPQTASGISPLMDANTFYGSCTYTTAMIGDSTTQFLAISRSGTITKTGAKSFSFTGIFYNQSTNTSYGTVTGSGNY